MELKDLIKARRLEINKTLEQVGNEVGVSKATVQRWESGEIKDMRRDKLSMLATALNTTPSYLMGWEEPSEKEKTAVQKIISSLPLFDVPVSAGGGEWLLDGHEYVFHEFEDAPHDADFALKVRGDSMSPNFNDGDIVFVRKCVLVEGGQIGVFYLNGEGYMKMLQGNRLVSLNDEYAPVTVTEYDEFFVAGRVVGKVK